MNKAHHGRKVREVVTSAGELKLSRVYFRCVKCREGGYALVLPQSKADFLS